MRRTSTATFRFEVGAYVTVKGDRSWRSVRRIVDRYFGPAPRRDAYLLDRPVSFNKYWNGSALQAARP